MLRWLLPLVVLLSCGGPDVKGLTPDLEVDDSDNNSAATQFPAHRWFPLSEGNTWKLESKLGTRTVRVVSFDGTRALVSGLMTQDTWLAEASEASQAVHRWDGQTWLPFIRFGLTRTAWSPMTAPCVNAAAFRSATGLAIDTPAGSFSQTATIALFADGAECPLGDLVELGFAADVGLVSLKTARGDVFLLTGGSVEGRAITGSGLVSTLELDSAKYTQGATAATVAHAIFSLSNTGTADRTWKFSTSCLVDVEIATLSGKIVKRASQDQRCTPGGIDLTIAAGAVRELPVDVPLVDADGLQLIGDFTATARLSSIRGIGSPAATVPFSVDVYSP